MVKNVLVVGDLHLKEKEPYRQQVINMLDYIFSSAYNNNETSVIFLGDLIEKISATPELIQVYIDLFLNKSNFKKIFILQGNHDTALIKSTDEKMSKSTILSVFKPLKNVQVIEKYVDHESTDDLPLNCLFLPHYDHEGTDSLPMTELYSSLRFDKEFDYCFHHVEDETMHFSNEYCNLSSLKVKNYLSGHIHTETITSKGRYLGAPVFNSVTEKGKTPYIALIDTDTKKYELIKVPIYIQYESVIYPEKVPSIDKEFCILSIHDYLDRQEAENYYKMELEKQGRAFYYNAMYSKQVKSDSIITTKDYKEKSLPEHFIEYSKKNNVKSEVHDICLNFLKTIENA